MRRSYPNTLLQMALVIVAGACVACTKAGDTTSASTGLSSLSSLPKATGSVSGSSAASMNISAVSGPHIASASTGVLLSGLDNVSWTAGTSRAMCETGTIIKEVYREASSPDKILCYVGVMEKYNQFTNPFDGNDHYYSLNPGGGALKIKFNIVKENGAIKTFKMWTCNGASPTTNSEYISQTFTGSAASIISVHGDTQTNGGATQVFANRATVSGEIDSAGAWNTKTLTNGNSFTSTGGAQNFSSTSYAEINQGPSSVIVSAYRTGTFGADSFTNRIYAKLQALGMGALPTFAIGDGSAQYNVTYGACGAGCNFTGTDSWTGDDQTKLGTASNGSYYAAASAGTLPTVGTPSTGFDSGETWDCTPASSFTAIDFSAIQNDPAASAEFSACDSTYGFNDYNWVDCNAAR